MKRRLLLIAISITVAASGVLPVYAATVKKHAVSAAGSELQEDEILLNSAPDSSGLGEDAMKGVAPADEADVFIAAPYAAESTAEAAGSAETTAAAPAVAETAAETAAATAAAETVAETEAETEAAAETESAAAETADADFTGLGAALSGSGDSEASDGSSGETASSETGLRSLGIFTTTGYYNNFGQASADGSWPRVGHTVSADWSVLPPGTRIKFGDSDIIYTVEDCGVHGNWVDVYYETSSQANSHGLQYKEVFLVE